MDQVHEFDYKGVTFLCSAEGLPGGNFGAAIRYRTLPDQLLRTLKFDDRPYGRPEDALMAAEKIAKEWADHGGGRAATTG